MTMTMEQAIILSAGDDAEHAASRTMFGYLGTDERLCILARMRAWATAEGCWSAALNAACGAALYEGEVRWRTRAGFAPDPERVFVPVDIREAEAFWR